MIQLACLNLIADRVRFAVTVVGIAFAVFLMVFQGSLLHGFTNAATRLVNSADGHIWIVARGVPCFDFCAPMPSRFREIALGVDGVVAADRVAAGFAMWRAESGRSKVVVVVGSEEGVGLGFPRPTVLGSASTTYESLVIDESNTADLEVSHLPAAVELGGGRATAREMRTGFGTFLGSPYVFTTYEDARRYLRWPAEHTGFISVRVQSSQHVPDVARRLSARIPEADIWTTEEFARKSAIYWLVKTGAGGALVTAAVLGFLVGLVVVTQNMYAITVERIEEFATLRAIGASKTCLTRILIVQAIVSGALGIALGCAAAVPGVWMARDFIAWVATPVWLYPIVAVSGFLMCLLGVLSAARSAVRVDPALVFRN